MLSGLGVTFKTMTKPAVTVQYPHEREDPPTRARGVIALKEENCTVCMLCARSCPDWCIYIEGHKEQRPPRREGGRPRNVSVLDRFDIDYALCMYCGICVEVCPFDALVLEPGVRVLRAAHRRAAARQGQARRVDGDRARARAARAGRRRRARSSAVSRRERCVRDARGGDGAERDRRRHDEERRARGAVPRRRARRRRRAVHPARPGVRRLGAGARLHRRRHRAVPVRDHADARADASDASRSTTTSSGRVSSCRVFLVGILSALMIDAFDDTEIELEAPTRTAEVVERAVPHLHHPVRGRRHPAARRAHRRRRPGAEGSEVSVHTIQLRHDRTQRTGARAAL